MATKNPRIIGMKIEQFRDLFSKDNEIFMRRARLIPTNKVGDEMALTSCFLSAIRLIDPFRRQVFGAIGLPVSGTIHLFTEIEFKEFDSLRIDGLIIIEKAGKVADAAFLEMKNDNNELDPAQLESYLGIAKHFAVPRVITVSNQFVSHPSQCPVSVKVPKAVELYHLSWSFILTVAHLLLLDNDVNIDDSTQADLMREVVDYFEFEKSGVRGFNQMKKGWRTTVENVTSSATLRQTDPDLSEAVESWIQEENDMALILSRELGLLVQTGEKKFKNDYSARLKAEIKNVIDRKRLRSRYKVHGAASDIDVEADFGKRTLSMSVSLDAPQDKQLRGQIGWLKQQLKRCAAKSDSIWNKLESELSIDIHVKYGGTERVRPTDAELETTIEAHRGKTLRAFSVVQVKDLGKSFSSPRKYVEAAEQMFLDYYQAIVQNLRKWEPPAPPIQGRVTDGIGDSDELD
jgi:hypothetical protein